MSRQAEVTTTLAAAATALALAAPVHADSQQDQSYIQAMNRMGFTADAHDMFLAQTICGEMEKVDPKKESVTAKGANWEFANALGHMTKNQIYGVLKAGITSYCPSLLGQFHKEVDNDPWIQLP